MTADVTDSSGETRSDSFSVRVGYTALEAMMSAREWQVAAKPVEVRVTTKTLDGEPQVAEGSVKVYALESPAAVQRLPIGGEDEDVDGRPDTDLSNPNNWALGKMVAEKGFTSDTNGVADFKFELPAGMYRATVETQDRFGKKVTGQLPIRVLEPEAEKLAIRIPHLFAAPEWTAEPGAEFMALWGTGYSEGRAFVEIEHRRKMIQRYWTAPGRTQQQIKVAVTEAMRGGFTVHVTQVRENRSYLQTSRVDVPWNNKNLELTWEHFVSKLQPGKPETWTAVIQKSSASGAGTNAAEKLAAEMVATLYDASLDTFAGHQWQTRFGFFRQDHTYAQKHFANMPRGFQHSFGSWGSFREHVEITYRSFPSDLTTRFWGYMFARRYGLATRGLATAEYSMNTAGLADAMPMAAAAPASLAAEGESRVMFAAKAGRAVADSLGSGGAAAGKTRPRCQRKRPLEAGRNRTSGKWPRERT